MRTIDQVLPAETSAQLTDDDRLLTRAEAATYLRRSVPTLERWAANGTGPDCRHLGGRVLYKLRDLRTFVAGGQRRRAGLAA
jgi:hypothetical protein